MRRHYVAIESRSAACGISIGGLLSVPNPRLTYIYFRIFFVTQLSETPPPARLSLRSLGNFLSNLSSACRPAIAYLWGKSRCNRTKINGSYLHLNDHGPFCCLDPGFMIRYKDHKCSLMTCLKSTDFKFTVTTQIYFNGNQMPFPYNHVEKMLLVFNRPPCQNKESRR